MDGTDSSPAQSTKKTRAGGAVADDRSSSSTALPPPERRGETLSSSAASTSRSHVTRQAHRLGVEVCTYDYAKDGHVEFAIDIWYRRFQWRVWRRFSRLSELHDYLDDNYAELPNFPEKTWAILESADFLERRMEQLQEYFDSLVQKGFIHEQRVANELGVSAPDPPVKVRCSFPWLEIHEGPGDPYLIQPVEQYRITFVDEWTMKTCVHVRARDVITWSEIPFHEGVYTVTVQAINAVGLSEPISIMIRLDGVATQTNRKLASRESGFLQEVSSSTFGWHPYDDDTHERAQDRGQQQLSRAGRHTTSSSSSTSPPKEPEGSSHPQQSPEHDPNRVASRSTSSSPSPVVEGTSTCAMDASNLTVPLETSTMTEVQALVSENCPQQLHAPKESRIISVIDVPIQEIEKARQNLTIEDRRVVRKGASIVDTAESTAMSRKCGHHTQVGGSVKNARRMVDSGNSPMNKKTANAESEDCVVCLAANRTHAFVPCGHRCCCIACAEQLLSSKNNCCPMCRQTVDACMQIFN